MPRPSTILAIAVAVTLVTAIGYFTFTGGDQATGTSAAAHSAGQDSTPAQADPMPSSPEVHPTPPSPQRQAAHDDDAPMDAAQMTAKQEERMRELDAAFMAEPVSAGWAASTERMIDSAFSDESLSSKGAPAPIERDVSCRMFTCRVDVTYADQLQADVGMQFMLGDVGAVLPKAKHVQFTRPDGSVQWVTYANTGRSRR